ncbi:mannosyl-oligosaccharide glucosidase [Paracoccidioides lutzii Pb01]|uniref:Mannosyl-oligosaccharide glucosidase n=1 Tax=Paracoccidioides lutzii (strain ATCC MYA-826 / Pb01) TaxID=502779 RepID=C1H1F8_PARBA|nr:mannosyl-oligosaccharide glucosidase [Paracoccidioides lutzii Pb01]EEH33552.2 mannosyl-oligosaccharide glucosidase [Paracoccidioides lutzii Pb01]
MFFALRFLLCCLLSSASLAARQDPLTAPDNVLILAKEVGRASNESLLWGPYRPNLYFGVRPRIPQSLLMGLIWAKLDDFDTVQQSGHTCEQNEGMAGYGWDEYDIRKGGRQTIHDAGNTIDLTIDFIKVPGGNNGGNWGARVKGTLRPDAPPNQVTTVIFYAAMEGLGSLQVANEVDPLGYEGDVKFKGSAMGLGDFTIDITCGPESNAHPPRSNAAYDEKPLDRTMIAGLQIPSDALWEAKAILFAHMKEQIDATMNKYGTEEPPPPAQIFTIANKVDDGNIYFVQKVFEGPFEFDILFSSDSSPEAITSTKLTKEIKSASASFSEKFHEVFSPLAPFNAPKYTEFSKAMFSNLVGGIGYFYGNSLVDRSNAPEYEEEDEGFWEEAAEARMRADPILAGPSELFTSIPSRPFFPRGFLWDEGFHLIPIIDWDLDLTLEITKSWFNLMDEDGWIAREQILGTEAHSKVPAEFQVQHPYYANPPTLFMILEIFVDKLQLNKSIGHEQIEMHGLLSDIRSIHLENPDLAISYLRSIYPLLKRHYFWFKKTQWGDIKSYDREAFSSKEAYRWRGRSVKHILASGLDDYPRPQPPHPGELHVDLISWMGMMTRAIRRIAEALGEIEDVEEFTVYETAITRNIDDLHWDKAAQTYCDATIDDYEEHVHVCHKGYVSIFPFMTGLIPADSPRLGPVLDLIQNPEELWSDYGIRSLSKKDKFYGTEENYWRSPIWININYLILKNLLDVAGVAGPHQDQAREMYTQLRKNIVENVFDQWKKTGFAWEQYNPETGAGQRTQHFTGWTSLVVKMMIMPDLNAEQKSGHEEL